MEIERLIDHRIYPRKALTEARQAYKDFCQFRVTPITSDRVRLSISVLPAHQDASREVVLSFLNFALDKAAESYFGES